MTAGVQVDLPGVRLFPAGDVRLDRGDLPAEASDLLFLILKFFTE